MTDIKIMASSGAVSSLKPSIHGERALGFWLYIMSDALIFAILFANYGVLLRGQAEGPGPSQIFELDRAGIETFLLLLSSLAFGLATIAALSERKNATLGWLGIVFILGSTFLFLEYLEFADLVAKEAGPTRSGFLSGFFALVGTHGLHVSFGLFGIAGLFIQISAKGLTEPVLSRLYRLGLFWHFLDIIWVGIFSFVYLPGLIP